MKKLITSFIKKLTRSFEPKKAETRPRREKNNALNADNSDSTSIRKKELKEKPKAKQSKKISTDKTGSLHDHASTKNKIKKKRWTIDDFQVPEKDGLKRFHDLNLTRFVRRITALPY